MPFKLNQHRRHRIPHQKHKVTNWAALIFPSGDPGGATLKAVFRLALRQTKGLIGSIVGLLGLALAVPDHTTLCRRAETPARTNELAVPYA